VRCASCGQENKDAARACRKCGRDLSVPPAWFPDWKWHARTLGIIYACVTVFYLVVSAVLKRLPEPYNIRRIPPEMTPWLKR